MRYVLLVLLVVLGGGCSTPPLPPDAAVPDLAVADLTPSCGHAAGEECCFAPPNLLICDPGLYCDGTRTCRAFDLAPPVDLRPGPGQFGGGCDGNADCRPDPNGLPIRCQWETDTATYLCCHQTPGGWTCI